MSKRSIAYAQEHDGKTTYIRDNYLNLNYMSKFDIITFIYCGYGTLIKSEREQTLKNICKALKLKGKIIFDVF